jgi:hypothetical protein
VPPVGKVREKVWLGPRLPEFQSPVISVVVWVVTKASFVHTTVSPALMYTSLGVNR